MEQQNLKGTIEAILFATGREVSSKELSLALEKSKDEIEETIYQMNLEYKDNDRGIEIIKTEDNYQLATRKEYYEQVYKIIDKRNKPKLSNAAIETLSIIAYNPRISRAEIEAIRGVNSDGTIYKLLDYNLIEETGKLDAPGRPGTYGVTSEFLRIFGFNNLNELPDLPRYKLDENQQIVIDDIIEEKEEQNTEELNEAPMPERETSKEE